MRRRSVDPAFFSSDAVIACSMAARLLFIGLWTLADREGLLLDEPNRIKRQVFPDDKVNAEALLAELAGQGLIDRYIVEDQAHIAIPSFKEHQSIHPHEAASKLLQPPRTRDMSLHGQPLVSNVTRLIKPSVNSRPSVNPPTPQGAVSQVFEAWVTSTGRERCKLDAKRTKTIRARLVDYPLEDVLDAVRGWERDPWPGRREQNEITILLRDSAHLEKFRDLHRQPNGNAVAIPEHYEGPTPLARQYWNGTNGGSLDNPPDALYPSGPSARGNEERECVTETDHSAGGRRAGPLAADIGALAARWQDPGGTQRAGALDPRSGPYPPLADRGGPAQVAATVAGG